MLKITDKIQIPLREFDFTFARSSGPGGQNVNKVNTKAFLTWHVEQTESLPWAVKDRFVKKFSRRISKEGKIIVVSQRFRDQGRNVADCITKLQELVRSVVAAPVKRRKTKPSKGAIQRRINDKKATSERKSRRRPLRGDE
ncbi:alternative ribosome rescue aminoacyl-tRNA hydrolase ArfB [Pirellulaceae bacterium]|jgi:ribosome-associated protein|nr:alternative ribosome rescue aminoacyl-tRNA hydrolase ArfB [Pirellulaceae bacterium]